jgi:hemoglobin/transferrin/lactoferrin receptor protein
MDLALQYRPLKNLIVRANINNVFDTKYWNWSDVRGVPAQSPVLDAYTAPGRSFNLSLRIDY